jgi:hypothetical protein
MDRQKQKQEALKRMKMLQIMKEVIEDFKENDKLYYSERQNSFFNATLYWVDNKPEWAQTIKEFEKKNGVLVYHCQLTHHESGDLLSLLYVGEYEDEWEYERKDLLGGEAYVKVINLDDDFCSDYGYIGIQPSMGGITRTW